MEICKIYLILITIINCILFSLEQSSEFVGVRDVRAMKSFYYSDNDEVFNSSSPIQAFLQIFNRGKPSNVVKVGDKLQLKMKIKASELFQNGHIIRCTVIKDSGDDHDEVRTLYNVCSTEQHVIKNWKWSINQQTFSTDFSVIPFFHPDVKNINITMLCHAIVCLNECPTNLNNYC